ncbi:MAG: endonuclease/exonuclease/phosphatase family protein [Actinomycetota bacterium]|nr:endonuclease/exonuclease/phosphatase family protein [Actinomycetota bacterium]
MQLADVARGALSGGDRDTRLITWNVARRSSGIVEQATALAARHPSIVALQEVTRQTFPLWRHAFALMGLSHFRTSLDAADPAREPAARRRTGVMLAARAPLVDVERPLDVPWPETSLCAATGTPHGLVDIFCVHVPNAANGQVKVQTLQGIRDGLTDAPPSPRVVCGDLNTPRRELTTGEVLSFARDSRGRLRRERGSEWDEAELGVVPGLSELGYRDAYRSLHGYARSEPSWTWKRIAGHDGGWRIDHVFVSVQLQPVACVYHHAWREHGLSDHSALEVDFH